MRKGRATTSILPVAAAFSTFGLLAVPAIGQTGAVTVETRIGPIPTQLGLPADKATSQKLYDELDFQRATQAYIWALPLVSFAEWQHAARTVFGAGDTDMVVYETLRDKLGIITANATTPYISSSPICAAPPGRW